MTTKELSFKAYLAEQTEDYQEMRKIMKQLVETESKETGHNKVILTEKERDMLLVAYQNTVGMKRKSWRILSSIEELHGYDEELLTIVRKERSQTEVDGKELCREVIYLIDKYLLPSEDTETTVFFNMMKGDYFRYQVEMSVGAERKSLSASSKTAYTLAYDLAENMSPVHPTKLSLVISLSVFYYEIEGSGPIACQFTKLRFNEAIDEMHSVDEEDFETTSLLLGTIRANRDKWCSEADEDEEI